jgi:hypothetical protein
VFARLTGYAASSPEHFQFLEVYFFPPVSPVLPRGLSTVPHRLVRTERDSLVLAIPAPPILRHPETQCYALSAVDTGTLGLQNSYGTRIFNIRVP